MIDSNSIPLLAIFGPTAIGKSRLAMQIAQAFDGELISADSRQIYRRFDIGTAKPTPEEQRLIPHHVIDICEPTEKYTVARYQVDAAEAIADVWHRGKLPILVGGTGLYIRSLLGGLDLPPVPPQPEWRAEWEALAEREGTPALHVILQAVDPASAERLHPNDRVRMIRALEVERFTGKPFSEQLHRTRSHPYHLYYVGLSMPKPKLEDRIKLRVGEMLEMGLVEEVKSLLDEYGPDLPLLKTLSYAELLPYFRGEKSLDSCAEDIFIHTRQYAKRQLTWMRTEQDIQIFNYECDSERETVYNTVAGMIRSLLVTSKTC